jgi:2-hydroxycyclohexanecarboxyl-CoA dehydrogenase
MNRYEGRNALVTGGASGIGAATVRRLAAEGARVAIADMNEDGAREIAAEVDGVAVVFDVRDDDAVRAGVAQAVEELGSLQVLVNNAGTDRFAFFTKSDPELWDFVLGVNLRGVLSVTHASLPHLQQKPGSAIVNIASEAGRLGVAGSSIYSAAKAGVIGFTKSIARESARYGVRVNAIAPGPIDTPLLREVDTLGTTGEKWLRLTIEGTVSKRLGTPEEVAAAIAFLASDDASYVTGQTLGVSGGLSFG